MSSPALTRPLTQVPVVITGRRDTLPRHLGGPLGALDRLVNRLSDQVVANSAAAAVIARETEGIPAEKVRVIRNTVLPPPPMDEGQRSNVRAELGAGTEDLLIGCVGNYREVKRHLLLLEAFAPLAGLDARVRLVLVGEGPERRAMEAWIAASGLGERIRLHGSVPDARPLYRAFDLVVQASRSEGLPNVILEAAAAARPIVATDAGGTAEVITDGENGLLVPVEDAQALRAAMQRVLGDRVLASRLGEAALRRVELEYGVGRYTEEWARCYEEMADRRGINR